MPDFQTRDEYPRETPKNNDTQSDNAAAGTFDKVFDGRTHPHGHDRLLSDKDVALRYKVEKQTIWRWIKTSSRFPKPIKIEGTTRWSELELDDHDRKLKEARK